MKKIKKYLSNIRRKYFLGFRIDGRGERVHIDARTSIPFDSMDIYQKSHTRRYEFAQSYVKPNDVCGDFACGTGYGTVMLAEKGLHATGADIDRRVVQEIKKRYNTNNKVSFIHKNLLNLSHKDHFDTVVSFETIEHFEEKNIPALFSVFSKALKKNGTFIFSTPYKQERSEAAIEAGFHLTFNIDEVKIEQWLTNAGFSKEKFFYQNYSSHEIQSELSSKEFIIGIAKKL